MSDAFEALAVGLSVAIVFSIPFAFFAFLRYLRYKETILWRSAGYCGRSGCGTAVIH
ncbi:MAG: hypothetical protein IPH82_25625 [Chloroflexi bacterium]|nr:hypothetical protein [Chloroflexota bacterium]